MSEVPIIAGVGARAFDEMDEGDLIWEARARLRQREEIIQEDNGIVVVRYVPQFLWCETDTEANWCALVQWLRDRDKGGASA